MPLQDYYNTGDYYFVYLGGEDAQKLSQTFTASSSYTISSVKLKLWRQGAGVGDLNISIQATSGGIPVTPDLCSGSIVASSITTEQNGDWYEITFSVPVALTDGIKYAIVAIYPGGDADHLIFWRHNETGYIGGSIFYDCGYGWEEYNYDFMFETYGVGVTYKDMSATGGGNGDGEAVLSIVIFKNLEVVGGGVATGVATMLSRVTMSDVVQRKRIVAVGNNQVWCGDVE